MACVLKGLGAVGLGVGVDGMGLNAAQLWFGGSVVSSLVPTRTGGLFLALQERVDCSLGDLQVLPWTQGQSLGAGGLGLAPVRQ